MRRETLREVARAKINLSLRVLGRRADGYHDLDSIVAFADIGDVLEARFATEDRLDMIGPFASTLIGEKDNLVSRAVKAVRAVMQEDGGVLPPLHIVLEKNLPIASGIGGGSADAAATVRLCLKLSAFQIDSARLNQILVKLGADVPVCFDQQQCRMKGIGDIRLALEQTVNTHAVLVNPRVPCTTPDVFKALGLKPGDRFNSISHEPYFNDLEAPAIQVCPQIGETLSALSHLKQHSRIGMSGSGATCFALFNTTQHARAAADELARTHADWWIAPCQISA